VLFHQEAFDGRICPQDRGKLSLRYPAGQITDLKCLQ
jgi:hypothetical protein